MPDGEFRPHAQQQPFHNAPGPVLNQPPFTKPAGGVAGIVGLIRTLTVSSVGLAVIVFGFQAVMPVGSKPSDLIGSFHGSTETAELKAKQEAAAEYERKLADARASAPANWQMEQAVNQTQMQAVAETLGTQQGMASLADFACLASLAVIPLFGDSRDAREATAALQSGCGAGDAIRSNMTETIARTAREGSGLVPRSSPTTGAGSAPRPVAVPALSR